MVGINSNLIAGSATRNLGVANTVISSSVARLSSGNRIIKASDDVAGLAIGTSIQTTVRTLQVALLNAQQATSVLSIADGALQQIGDILTRQKALAAQATSGSLGTTERSFLNQEFQALVSEIDRIVDSTSFNGIILLNGSLGSASGRESDAESITYSTAGTIGTSALDGTDFTIDGDPNANLIGSLASAVVTAADPGDNGLAVVFTLSFNGSTYTSDAQDLDDNSDAPLTVTFTDQISGNTIEVKIATYDDSDPGQDAANVIAASIQADVRTITVYQNRSFSTDTAGVPSTNTDGTILAGLSGDDVFLNSTAFGSDNTAPVFGAVRVTAETQSSDGAVSITVGGVTYSTVVGQFDGVEANIQGEVLGGGDNPGTTTGVLRLYKAGDADLNPEDYLDIDIASNAEITGIDNDSVGAAAQLQSALNALFGVGNQGALSFQIGSATTDTIAVSIASAKTADIYVDNDGNSTTIDVTSQANANTASDVLDNAISNIIGVRAGVGAATSRFNFASSNLEVSIANQDAARGSFLDADVATESTSFATAQVKLQASIAVLAQANQLPATLLRLLQ